MSIDIDHLETLAREATEGPWHVRENGPGEFFVEAPGSPEMPYRLDVCGDDYVGHGDDEQRRRNWDFIAAADPDTILSIVERLRAAETHEQALAAYQADLVRELSCCQRILHSLAHSGQVTPEYADEAKAVLKRTKEASRARRDAEVRGKALREVAAHIYNGEFSPSNLAKWCLDQDREGRRQAEGGAA